MSVKYTVPFFGILAIALGLAPANPVSAADPQATAAKTGAAEPPAATAPAEAEHGQDARVTPAETKGDSGELKDKDSAAAAKAPAKKVKQLSAEMIDRRDRLRKLLAALRPQPFNTQQNTCTDVLEFCRAFGCETELTDNATSGRKVNGITCLCWNMPCAGYEMLTISEGHLAPRVGYGYQDNSSELAAVLALSNVPADYPARAGRAVRTVADVIEYEKLTCRPGTDMSLKLVALANYVQQPSWKDSLGGEWTLKRVVAEELARPLGAHPHAATNRLLGLGAALERFKKDKVPLDGDLGQAKRYFDESVDYAYAAQNTDASWGRPTNRDYSMAVSDTAHMLQWLVTTLPVSHLEGPPIARSIDFLCASLSSTHYQTYIPLMSAREISAAMHAAYVLNVYDRRVFVPADPLPPASGYPIEPAKTEKPDQKSAGRAVEAR